MNPSIILRLRREVIEKAVKDAPVDPPQTAEWLNRMIVHIAGNAFDAAIEAVYPCKLGGAGHLNANSRSDNYNGEVGSLVAKAIIDRCKVDPEEKLQT